MRGYYKTKRIFSITAMFALVLSIFAIGFMPKISFAIPSFEELSSNQYGLGIKTATISPNGDVATGWSVNPSGDHFAAIDDTQREPTLQDVSNFISTNVADAVDEFDMTTVSDASVISKLEFWGLIEGSSEDIGISLDFGSGWGDEEVMTTGTLMEGEGFDSIVFTGRWTKAELDSLKVKVRAIDGLGAIVYNLYANVSYTLSANISGAVVPNGDVTSDFDVTPSGDHFSAVDDAAQEPTVPDLNDYIESNDQNYTDVFDMSTIDIVGHVNRVTVWVYGDTPASDGETSASVNLSGSFESDVSLSLPMTGSAAWVSAEFYGVWDKSELDSMQVRLKRDGNSATLTTIYAVYATVDYDWDLGVSNKTFNLGDINGDGVDDIGVSDYLGPSGSCSLGSTCGKLLIFLGGSDFDKPDFAIESAGDSYFAFQITKLGRFNNDGYDDFAILGYTGGGVDPIDLNSYIYFGGASFNTTADLTISNEVSASLIGTTFSAISEPIDINDDGFCDIILPYDDGIDNEMRIYYGGLSPDGTNDDTITNPVGYYPAEYASAGDFNGDEADDARVLFCSDATHCYYQIYLGGGTITEGANTGTITLNDAINSNFINDVNGDGKSEFAYFDSANSETKVYFGGDSIGAEDFVLPLSRLTSLGDVNGDSLGDFEYNSYVYPDSTIGIVYGDGNASNMETPDISMTTEYGVDSPFLYMPSKLNFGDFFDSNEGSEFIFYDSSDFVGYVMYLNEEEEPDEVVRPSVTVATSANPTTNDSPTFSGECTSDPTRTIKSCKYRIDGGNWSSAIAVDGGFNEQVEEYQFVASYLSVGTHLIEVKAVDSSDLETAESNYGEISIKIESESAEDGEGDVDDTTGDESDDSQIDVGNIDTQTPIVGLDEPESHYVNEKFTVRGFAASGSVSSVEYVKYSIDGGSNWSEAEASDGVYDQAREDFSFDLSFNVAGRYQILAKATDSRGRETRMSQYATAEAVIVERSNGENGSADNDAVAVLTNSSGDKGFLGIVRSAAQKVIEFIEKYKTATVAMVVASTALATASAIVSLSGGLFSQATLKEYLLMLFNYLLSLFAGRKRDKMGLVYDATTKKGVGGVLVNLFDFENMKLVSSSLSDKKGHFFFTVRDGRYVISAVKSGFLFPSLFVKNDPAEREKAYIGQTITIEGGAGIINVKVPVDPTAKAVPKKRSFLLGYFQSTAFRLITLLLATIFALLVLYVNRSTINYLICGLYGILWLIEFFIQDRDLKFSRIFDRKTYKPIDLALVRVISGENKLVSTYVTDYMGRFMAYLPNSGDRISVERIGYENQEIKNLKKGFLENRKFYIKEKSAGD